MSKLQTKPHLLSFIRAKAASSFNSHAPPLFHNATDLVYVKNHQIDAFVKSNDLNTALQVFNRTPWRDAVTYNLLISGHRTCRGPPERALRLFAEMGSVGVTETPRTFTSIISLCANGGFRREGLQLHCRVVKFGFSTSVFVGGALIGFYMNLGLIGVALKLFDELPERNLALWNVFLSGLSGPGCVDESLIGFYYSWMGFEGVEPNGVTFCYLLRGYGSRKMLREGEKVQGRVLKMGLVGSNAFVANALVDFYSACGCLAGARKCFEAMLVEDVISWNSLVHVYAENDLMHEALELFTVMQLLGKRPSVRSLVGILNLCSRAEDIGLGKQAHSCAVKLGFDKVSVYVQSALIDMYGKCGEIESSVSIFECFPEKNLECCNSLLTSLSHCGAPDDVVELFGLMVDEGLRPDEVTFSTTLKALSVSASANYTSSQLLHCFALKSGLESDAAVTCSLMDAYSKCGHVEHSHQIFEALTSPNDICFTSMINGYARNGMGDEGLAVLQAMIDKGLKPDRVTFLCALTGCSHKGLVEEGRTIFNLMKTLHGVHPDRQHYSCMVDLLCRSGLLYEAEEFLLHSPERRDCVMWSSLLRSCIVHKNEEVGIRAAKVLVELDPDDPAVWLQASNFYAQIGKFDASRQIKEVSLARKMTREIGRSLIEIKHLTSEQLRKRE